MSSPSSPLRLAVLGSGSGSNFQSILEAIEDGRLQAEVVVVLSDQPEAYILERARKAGLRAELLDCGGFKTKFPEECQAALAERLLAENVDFICLAGFMRLVKAPLLEAFPSRILNIHPSLLPHYPGLKAWEQAVLDQAQESGCTVHYVDGGMDTGAIIAQARVPVFPEDTAESLHARIQGEEHRLYPEVLTQLSAQRQA